MKPDLSLVVMFLNEEENIKALCESLNEYAACVDFSLQVIFVDDGSNDGSAEAIRKAGHKNYLSKLLVLSKNFGSHAALRAGLQYADADICFYIGADMQEPLSMIGQLYEKIREGNDIVCAIKKTIKVGKTTRFFSQLFSRLIRRFAIPTYPLEGVNNIMFNRKVKDHLNTHIESNSSIMLQIISLGFKRADVEADYAERLHGKSKWTLSKKVKMLIDSFAAFSYFPIRMVSVMGIVLAIIGVLFALYTIIVKIFDIYPLQAGWPMLISVILFGFGLTNIALGIIAEYLWRTLDVSRNRPVFIVDTIEDLKQNME